MGNISDTEDFINASCYNFHHDGVAAFKLSEWSPVPPALSAKDLPRWHSQVINVHRIKRIDRYPSKSDEDSAPDSISDIEYWLDCNGDFYNAIGSEDNWEADNESDTELDNGVTDSDTTEGLGSECCTERFQINLANTEVKLKVWKGVDDGQYHGNEKEYGKQEKVVQNESMYFHLVLYVVWVRIVSMEILWGNIEQSPVNIDESTEV